MNFFITNRNIIEINGKEVIQADGKDNAGDNLRFGIYDMGLDDFILFPEPLTQNQVRYDELLNTPDDKLKGSALFFKKAYQTLIDEPGDILCFIHGFNTNLNGVKEAFNNLNKKYVDTDNSPIKHILIFTWPSKSPFIPYHYFDDKFDAIRSGEALGRCFEKVMNFLLNLIKIEKNPVCERNIHLMVHSMGNRVLKHMVLSIPNKFELFKEIVLVAADVEYTIFEENEAFYNLINIGSRIHIYYHEKDYVLGISKFTKNFNNRLGQYGRRYIYSSNDDIFEANVTATSDDPEYSAIIKDFNHWYYYSTKEVVNDIINVFNNNVSKYTKK